MTEQATIKSHNAWIAIDVPNTGDMALSKYTVSFEGASALYASIENGDWLLLLTPELKISRIGHVLRMRVVSKRTVFYFDKLLIPHADVPVSSLSLSTPTVHNMQRLEWQSFSNTISKLGVGSVSDIPPIDNQAYIRELLQLAVIDDLQGPASGPHEHIVDMSVRDRYLVGKLAPRKTVSGEVDGLTGVSATEDTQDPQPQDERKPGLHQPGAEFSTTTGKVEPENDSADEIDASNNQSLIPSSFGMTFCIDADTDAVEVEVRWGRYERITKEENPYSKIINRKVKDSNGNVTETREEETKVKAWQRIPCGGKIVLPAKEGLVSHQAPDKEYPEVRIQGAIRPKNSKGERLVTLFLVNAQEEPETNKDTAWVFQPELIVRATQGSKPIFKRRPALDIDGSDQEREMLEMVYRGHVEFAVGHGISVHAQVSADNSSLATEVRTVVIPQHEIPVTETPGLDSKDRPAMKEMVSQGYLDMERLATVDKGNLIKTLNLLANDYSLWIVEQGNRIGNDVKGYDERAEEALKSCQSILIRLQEGIRTLDQNDAALKAFRLANKAMANQRIRSLYALSVRRKENKSIEDFNKSDNRSWRPFQLAFLLLSVPSLSDPNHSDRTKPLESYADLLWFPTGGGKTEAYLGVAAFTMFMRRLQGDLGGYDSSRGLAVVMRYTLRLLTLQQFQRATTLICAMEILRREALRTGDQSLGMEPFTIGLWVGNKVTPGTTEDSHAAIENIRNPGKYNAGVASPAQLTSCPWCGTEVFAGRDIKVNKSEGRTSIYCGDRKGICEFSEGGSSKQPHPGIPMLVVDDEIYSRPPTMMIATVDKFAMMAWRGQARTLFGKARQECLRHGLLWPNADCNGNHQAGKGGPAVKVRPISLIRPPDLIIQDEFHLISGPLGTMVGLYESAVDELCGWQLNGKVVKPKIIASTATVRKAKAQVNSVFMRRVAIFPPNGLDVGDNFFSCQRPIEEKSGRRYLGICSPGSSRPAVLIRVYTAFLTAGEELFKRFGAIADPYMTLVGYFNSLRELGGMKRLAEDDVQTRSYRVQMSLVERPGLAQRSVNRIRELTSRVSNQDIPKHLDELEIKFKAQYDKEKNSFSHEWKEGEARAIDVVLATNMLSVGVDISRLGIMVVNGQPKGTAEYIQATSRVGRSSPGLVCTVLTWARPRDLSHYETFEHYHATFYKHVEAQSVTPFSPRALDRGLTGTMLSLLRLENDDLNPNEGAGKVERSNQAEITQVINTLTSRAWSVTDLPATKDLAEREMKERADQWAKEASKPGRILAYEKRGQHKDRTVALIKVPGKQTWDNWTVRCQCVKLSLESDL
jgi:hypothetical protein